VNLSPFVVPDYDTLFVPGCELANQGEKGRSELRMNLHTVLGPPVRKAPDLFFFHATIAQGSGSVVVIRSFC
jgi:hypothetical protein